jgi:hypothetical protein
MLHSLLASRQVKRVVRDRLGERVEDGAYRLVFNGIALITFLELLRRFSHLPDRTLYRVRGIRALPFRIVQGFAVYLALDANIRTGIGRMTGIAPALQLVRGAEPEPQNPAQGPQLTGNLERRTGGAFRLSRHPNNLVPVLLWWANPKMTVRFLVFTLVATLYLVLGSFHEERRLEAQYGAAYDEYRRGKPFFL